MQTCQRLRQMDAPTEAGDPMRSRRATPLRAFGGIAAARRVGLVVVDEVLCTGPFGGQMKQLLRRMRLLSNRVDDSANPSASASFCKCDG